MSGASSPSSIRWPSESVSLPPSSTAPTSPGRAANAVDSDDEDKKEDSQGHGVVEDERIFEDEVSLRVFIKLCKEPMYNRKQTVATSASNLCLKRVPYTPRFLKLGWKRKGRDGKKRLAPKLRTR